MQNLTIPMSGRNIYKIKCSFVSQHQSYKWVWFNTEDFTWLSIAFWCVFHAHMKWNIFSDLLWDTHLFKDLRPVSHSDQLKYYSQQYRLKRFLVCNLIWGILPFLIFWLEQLFSEKESTAVNWMGGIEYITERSIPLFIWVNNLII